MPSQRHEIDGVTWLKVFFKKIPFMKNKAKFVEI